MQSHWFWNSWSKDFRWIWFMSAAAFIGSLVFFWFTYFQGPDGVIHWERIQEQKVLESTVHSFRAGPFELSVPAENYLILEYFNGSQIEMNIASSVIFVMVLIFCGVVLLTVITILERFWYFMGMALLILFVVSLRLEVLGIFFQRNQIPAILLLATFMLLSYFFQALKPSVQFKSRLLSFLALTILAGVLVYLFAGVQYPMLHLSVTAYTAGMVLSVIFILMVAHEVPAAFVYIVSQGNSKSLRHFSIISTIYIFNIIVTCLHELNVIHWNFIYINLYLLLSISTILGLWGFKRRESEYGNILPFAPYGAYFFLALATICFVTIGQLFGTSNDAALRIIRDVIIFSHVGFGVIFLTYVFSNFVFMLAKNLPVYKVLYKPNRMPYFSFRLAGFIVTLSFVFYSNWRQYAYNGIAGFYNNIGDLYELLDHKVTAEAYYEQGRNYGFENNHANYALAALKADRYDYNEALRNYELANGKRPTVYSLINAGNLFIWENKIFESIEAYQYAEKKMPNSGEIENNLGSAYGRVHKLDSAIIFLNKARGHSNSKSSAETNFFAIAAQEYLPIKCDSILKIFKDPSDATISNAVALATLQQQEFKTKIELPTQRRLNLYKATLLSNYVIQHVKSVDSTYVDGVYKMASDSLNRDYSEALKSSLAFSYYHLGNVNKALKILGELAYISQSHQGKFNYIMGLWALEQNNPKLAASYFDYSVDADYKDGKLYKAIALTEAQLKGEALVAWDTVANRKDEGEKAMALVMKKILTANITDAASLTDAEKYQFCRYRLSVKDTVFFNKLVNTFKRDDYRTRALLDVIKRQYEWGNLQTAMLYFNRVASLKISDKLLYNAVRHTELLMLAERRELNELAIQIKKGVDFGEGEVLEKIYYTALLNEHAGDTLNATRNFGILGAYNPYFEEGIIAAADYFRGHSKNPMKAYTILVDAIQVNNNSVKLMKAYAAEALRMGFTEYSESALVRVDELYSEENRLFK